MSEAAVMSDAASDDAYSLPLDKINVGQPHLFKENAIWPYFERLRNEDPVHYCAESDYGPYWSVTKYNDIMKVDTNHGIYSSESGLGGITIRDPMADFQLPMFIAMDQPKHDVQRKVVTPAVSPVQLSEVEPMIRKRVGDVLDSLPVGETFNWVDLVSIELTTQMLATLFDFPFEERRKLTYWSDISASGPQVGDDSMTEEFRLQELTKCLEEFNALWQERKAQPRKNDFISLMAHHPDMQNMDPMEYLGNLMLLIVGGNDTTRNSMSGGVVALNQNPAEYDKLRADPSLIPNMVSEIIRWQTPLAHMRRNALEDVELGGKTIKKGDKVVMWYISGNRDDEVIDRPDEFIIDRPKARHHVSFGFGIHRCMGNRLAEMQIKILWEEILKRFSNVELVGEPVRVTSNFVMGYSDLPVRLHAK